MLETNYREVEKKIAAACERSGRNRDEVQLIAVSKTKPVEMIETIYELDQRDFGENKPQELRDKFGVLPNDIKWHMIGHLQKNKIKYVVGRACMIHSVDSYDLAAAIDKEAEKKQLEEPVSILIEVNVAEEESKFGIQSKDTLGMVRRIAQLPHVQIQGLMTIAPYVDDQEENRGIFRTLRQLSVDIDSQNIDNVHMNALSMGMTNDYEVAIEEGATLIRVGTGIFGERDYGNKNQA